MREAGGSDATRAAVQRALSPERPHARRERRELRLQERTGVVGGVVHVKLVLLRIGALECIGSSSSGGSGGSCGGGGGLSSDGLTARE